MTSPTFQKNGPYSGSPGNRKSAPTLVFRQKSSRPLLLNSHALSSNFKATYAGDRYSPHKARYVQTNTPQPRSEVSSFTPLAQYFTFTGRLNPVRESKLSKQGDTVNSSDVIEKFESTAYKLKINSQEFDGSDTSREEHNFESIAEGREYIGWQGHSGKDGDTGVQFEKREREETVRDEEQQCFHYFSPTNDRLITTPHLDTNNNNMNTLAVDSTLRLQPRPQSAAISYALHKQISPQNQKRPNSSCNARHSSSSPGRHLALAPPSSSADASSFHQKPNHAAVVIPEEVKSEGVTTMNGEKEKENAYRRNEKESEVVNSRESSSSNNGSHPQSRASFNSRVLFNNAVRTPRQSNFRTNSAHSRYSGLPSRAQEESSVSGSATVAELNKNASEKISYLQRINSASLRHSALPTNGSANIPQTNGFRVTTADKIVQDAEDTSAPAAANVNGDWEIVKDSSSFWDESSLAPAIQPSQYSKPVQYVRPIVRPANHALHQDNNNKKNNSNNRSAAQKQDNVVVVKVLKEGAGEEASQPGAAALTNRRAAVKDEGGAVEVVTQMEKGVTQVTRKKFMARRSSSSESQTTTSRSTIDRKVLSKSVARNNSVNSRHRVAKHSSKTQQQNVTSKAAAALSGSSRSQGQPLVVSARPNRLRRPLSELEQMHDNLGYSSGPQNAPTSLRENNNIAKVDRERMNRPEGRTRSVSRHRSTTREREDDRRGMGKLTRGKVDCVESEYGMNVVHLRDYSYLSYAASSRCLPGYLRMLQQHSLSEQMANFVSDHLHQVHVILCDYKLQGILVTAERFDLPVVSVFSDNDPGPLAHYDEHRQVSLPLQMLEKVSLYSLHSWRKLTRHSFGLADLADDTDSFYTEYSGRFPFIVLNERSSPNGTFPSTMQPRFLSLPGLTDGNLSVERDAMPLVQFMKSVAARKFSDLMPIYGYEVVSLKFLLMHHFSLLFVLSLCCVLTAVILFTLLFRKRKQKTD